MTQYQIILRELEKGRKLSPMDAYKLGITKLATRISEMKRKGYEFEQAYDYAINQQGKKVKFMTYWLKETA